MQLSGATPKTGCLISDTNYWVRDLVFGSIDGANKISMPNGVTYSNGITLGRTYFVTGASGNTFQIAETAGGTPVPLTSSNSRPSGLIDGERFQLSSAADPC